MSADSRDLWYFERIAMASGNRVVAGVDEAGRGPLAGPVVAAAVALPFDCDIDGIDDSKQLSEKKRDTAYDKIVSTALGVGVGIIGPEEIDRINILQATYNAMRAAISQLTIEVDIFLIDGSPIRDFGHPHQCIVGGDSQSASIAAASIIAKVTRDRIMREYDLVYPQYGFARHKGYPTKDHLRCLSEHGVCEIHRKSFSPVTEELNLLWKQTKLPLAAEGNSAQ